MPLSFIELAYLLGVAITIDVSVVTLAKFQDENISFLKWVIPITMLHVLFFGVAYAVAWSTGQAFDGSLHLKITGIIGFVIIMYVVYVQYCEAIDVEPVLSLPDLDGTHLLLMIGVSLDAPLLGLAGPATVPVETITEYSRALLAIGVAVGITAAIATLGAIRLRNIKFKNVTFMKNYNIFGRFLAVAVLSFFGISSLLQGFEVQNNFFFSAVGALALTQLAFLAKKEKINLIAKRDAREAIADPA